MTIVEELRNGTLIYESTEEGLVATEIRPPTSKELRAARTIVSLTEQLQGLSRAYESLERQHNDNLHLLSELNEKRSMVQESVA